MAQWSTTVGELAIRRSPQGRPRVHLRLNLRYLQHNQSARKRRKNQHFQYEPQIFCKLTRSGTASTANRDCVEINGKSSGRICLADFPAVLPRIEVHGDRHHQGDYADHCCQIGHRGRIRIPPGTAVETVLNKGAGQGTFPQSPFDLPMPVGKGAISPAIKRAKHSPRGERQ